ncbi:MAG: hypothetical protein M1823_006288 [Watsoniomyces obsoletus]|nr:MAG: hypothetical protein M1823_006288 [Watsoniomyces obsoletus]
MTSGPTSTPSATTPSQAPMGAPASGRTAHSNATRRDLASWWKRFNVRMRKEEEKAAADAKRTDTPGTDDDTPRIFGVPLQESIKYANVAISLTDAEGKSFIYGYVPIVVAKCGVFLKEKATDVEGIFRLSGSSKRIKDLQTIFNAPDRYGKGLDWTGFTVHDAANILRRYLNQLPEPIIPLEFYHRFRDPLVQYAAQQADAPNGTTFDEAGIIATYQQVITELPPLNRQLLLYILDLLAVFASKSDVNRMTSTNLAAIFQPGILSHPQHDMEPEEYRLSQDVLVFLIENQDHFLIGMRGTAADEATVRDVQSGGGPVVPTTPAQQQQQQHQQQPLSGTLERSSSQVSAEGGSVRRLSGLRRNVSVSSQHSSRVSGQNSPALTRSTPGSAGVYRSNTLPSKKSPGLTSNRFPRGGGVDSPLPPSPGAVRTDHLAMTPTSEYSMPVLTPPPTIDETPPTYPLSSNTQESESLPTLPTTPRTPGRQHQPVEAEELEVPREEGGGVSSMITVMGTPTPTNTNTMIAAADPEMAQLGHVSTGQGTHSSRESLPLDVPSPPAAAAAAAAAGGPTSIPRSASPIPPSKERNFSMLFSRSPNSDTERGRESGTVGASGTIGGVGGLGKTPNKLRKKRIPGTSSASAQSSTHSLPEGHHQ